MYAMNKNSLEITEFSNESTLGSDEKLFTGIELIRWIGEQFYIDNENPPYIFA
jgi:hypothetical protein